MEAMFGKCWGKLLKKAIVWLVLLNIVFWLIVGLNKALMDYTSP